MTARHDALLPLPVPCDDAALVRALTEGDPGALGALYDRHAPALLGLAVRMLGDAGEAEDLVHDLFVEAWRKAGEYDARRSTVRTWLAVRLRSRALDRLRSARYTRLLPLLPESALEPAGEGHVHRAAEQRQACDRLGCLSSEQRQALELAYFAGLSAAQIARRLDVPVGTVKSRLGAALRRLRGESGPQVSGAGSFVVSRTMSV